MLHRGLQAVSGTFTAPSYEDLTTYTESDPSGNLTVTANNLAIDITDGDNSALLDKDFAVDYFAGNFEFRFKFNLASYVNGLGGQVWLLNVNNGSFATDHNGVKLDTQSGVKLRVGEDVTNGSNITGTLSTATDYYVKFYRDTGVGTYGTVYISIYSNPGYSTLVDSASYAITHTGSQDFQTLEIFNGYLFNGADIVASISNVEILAV